MIYKNRKVYTTNKVAVVTGNVIHFKKYEKDVWYGCSNEINLGKKNSSNAKTSDNINKAKFKLRDLINSNISKCKKGNRDVFLTLTYAKNMTDVSVAKDDFKKFIKRWDYYRKKSMGDSWEKLKYIYVVEFQKRGAVHFHCIFFDLEFTKVSYLNDLWKGKNNLTGKGNIKINAIDNVDNVGAYVVKYMSKELVDDRLLNRDLYGRSKGNLEEPIKITNPQEVAILEEAYKENIIYSSTFNNDYTGMVVYHQANLKRNSNSDDRAKRDFLNNMLNNIIDEFE